MRRTAAESSAEGLARALRAFSNRVMFFRTYVRYALDFKSPVPWISWSFKPAAAGVDAPPMRRECGDTLSGRVRSRRLFCVTPVRSMAA